MAVYNTGDATGFGKWLSDADSYLKDFWNNHPGSSPTVDQTMSGSGAYFGNDSVSLDGERVIDNPNPVGDVVSNSSISDAFSYGKLEGSNVEEQLQWLINNDPENAQGWMEQLLGLRANRENTNDAREYERFIQDTRIQRTAKDLEAAGINPILAYQYLSGSSSSVGTAGYPDIGVSNQAVDRASNKATVKASDNRAIASIAVAMIALLGIAVKAAL